MSDSFYLVSLSLKILYFVKNKCYTFDFCLEQNIVEIKLIGK